jgi:FkbM family methyltransferase
MNKITQTTLKALKANRLLRKLIIPIIDKSILITFYQLFNKPFKVKLINGKSIKIYPQGQIALSIFNQRFEKQEIDTFQRIVKPGMTIVDAGANIGLYSLIGSTLVGDKGSVFSFEPSLETFQRFQNNIKLNRISNITPLNFGLGDKPNEKLILRQDKGYGDAERYLFPVTEFPSIKLENMDEILIEEEIIIDTLDNYLKKSKVQKIDFLKIDTEGFEFYILKGAEQILKNSPEIILLMECTALGTARAKTTQKEVFKILKEINLSIFYWNKDVRAWCDDEEGILKAGDVWVCNDKNKLIV